jgi:hypothetical protein
MIKAKSSKSKNSSKGSKELATMYKEAFNSKEVEYGWLAPDSYTTEQLIKACKQDKRLYRPLAKSFGLV